MDHTTQDVLRGKYAKVCVEVQLNRPLTPTISLAGKHFTIEYEGLHQICFSCGKYGHRKEGCTEGGTIQSVPTDSDQGGCVLSTTLIEV